MKAKFNLPVVVATTLLLITGCTTPRNTINNLKTAINSQTTGAAKYTAFGDRAEAEGYPKIAALFRATSKAKEIHAANFRNVLLELDTTEFKAIIPLFDIDSTLDNLQVALMSEKYETTNTYPKFINTANKENADSATEAFTRVVNVTLSQEKLYTQIINNLFTLDNPISASYFICSVCGNIYAAKPSLCDICNAPERKFESIHAVMPLSALMPESTPVAEP